MIFHILIILALGVVGYLVTIRILTNAPIRPTDTSNSIGDYGGIFAALAVGVAEVATTAIVFAGWSLATLIAVIVYLLCVGRFFA